MIESRYNYYTQDGDNVICLNGISKMVFSVQKETFKYVKELLEDERKQKEDLAITEELAKMHFLVDNSEQEINSLLDEKRKDANSSFYHLIINPTQDCIFRCWYCYETHHSNSKMSEDTISNIRKFVVNTLEREDIDNFMVSWFGGEPLMYFDDIVYSLSLFMNQEAERRNKKFLCNMTTNGFLLTQEVIEKCKLINLTSLQITLDGDEKTHNRTRNRNGEPSFKTIIDNCINYCSYSIDNKLILRINYTDKIIQTDFTKVLDYFPVELRPQIDVQFKRVWQTYEKKTQKIPDGLLDNVKNLGKMNFKQDYKTDFSFVKGCLCYADRNNYANLNFDGKAYKCTAIDYNAENAMGYLNNEGNIIWEKDKMGDLCLKPHIEGTKCMECNLLPICGGPCFQRKLKFIINNIDFCSKDNLDTDVDTFVKKYYHYIQEKKKDKALMTS